MAEGVQAPHTVRPVQIVQAVGTAAVEEPAGSAAVDLPEENHLQTTMLKAGLKNTNHQILTDLRKPTPVNLPKFLSMR